MLKLSGASPSTEFMGGVINFALLAYAPLLNAAIVSGGLGEAFFPALMTTTIILTFIFTLANAIYANVPFAQSVYMGENAFFAFALVAVGQIPWQTALGIVFWAGIAFFIITMVGLRKRLAQAIPRELALTWGIAVALFLAYLAVADVTLFVPNTAGGLPTLPGDYRATSVIAFAFLLLVIGVLYAKLPTRIRGIGMLVSIVLAVPIGLAIFGIPVPTAGFGISDPSMIVFQVDFIGAFNYLQFILIFVLIELVDVSGTLKALVTPMKLPNEEQVIEKVMRVEGVSTAVGALLGQPTVGTYIESGGAVAAGARTGLASVVTAILFLGMLFLTPFFSELPFWFLLWITAPALLSVAAYMAMNVIREFDFRSEPTSALLMLMVLPGVLGGNLLLAFAVPMAATAIYEGLTRRKVSTTSIILTVLGLVILAIYHY